MSTHYLIDAHTSPINNSPINDIRFSPANDTSPCNGNFVVRVDDSLDIRPEQVTTLPDLLSQKYAEVLAAFPGFSNIIYDDMLDPTGIDTANTNGALRGDRGTISMAPTQLTGPPAPSLRTNTVVVGGAPSECVVVWELFSVSRSDAKADRMVRSYVEEDPADLQVAISWDNWASTNLVTSGSMFNIPGTDQGIQMILSFTVASVLPSRRYIGSWAVIY